MIIFLNEEQQSCCQVARCSTRTIITTNAKTYLLTILLQNMHDKHLRGDDALALGGGVLGLEGQLHVVQRQQQQLLGGD